MALITLKDWNKKQPIHLCDEQVRRLVRKGLIYPAPELYGRCYLVEETAVRLKNHHSLTPGNTSKKLIRRIIDGRHEKKRKNS
ncbi:excisionase [Salmonella enterica subsp. enterica]|uniref:Excisionase n=1 Tax=Salmonella enterica TaxID=28901 RepID=A0A754E3Z4_SALER|nr:excisionase [Salmonella enterica subsp. enterica serovar Enteritidis]ECU9162010.1 excisionase [Salmonella enterica subsp. enterica serovar Newport str. CFSAN000599]EDU1196573.1 excisionase [Salmonella enterica subsp. enterica serovar Heidelberg str. CFSAN000576]HAF8579398.1 excisionase [Salmonella enterica]